MSATTRSWNWNWINKIFLSLIAILLWSTHAQSATVDTRVLNSDGFVLDGSTVAASTNLTAATSGLLTEGTGKRTVQMDLDQYMIFRAGTVVAPEGWNIEYYNSATNVWVTSEPTNTSVSKVRAYEDNVVAGAVTGVSQAYSRSVVTSVPAATFSSSSGGDGWDVFFYDNYVMNIFHHSNNVVMHCAYRSTWTDDKQTADTSDDVTYQGGSACSEFGSNGNVTFSGYDAGNRSGGWVDAERGLVYAFSADSTNKAGALCIDLNTSPPSNCGFIPLDDDTGITSYGYLSNAVGSNGKLFGIAGTSGSEGSELVCLDAATKSSCTGFPKSLGETASVGGSQIHVYQASGYVWTVSPSGIYCINSDDLTPCAPAWDSGTKTWSDLVMTPTTYPPVAHMDTSGVVDGLCVNTGCIDLSGTKTAWNNPFTSITGINIGSANSYGAFTTAAGRAFLPNVLGSTDDVYCYDYKTDAPCTQTTFMATAGRMDVTNGVAVPSRVGNTTSLKIYAVVQDPNNENCVWYNGDSGAIGIFDALTGENTCGGNPVVTLQPSQFAPRFVCSTPGGIDSWGQIEMSALAGSGFSANSQKLTVRTGNGVPVSGWTDIPIALNTPIDLSTLSVNDTGARPTFNVQFSGTSGTLNTVTLDVDYKGRGPELCIGVNAVNSTDCPVSSAAMGKLEEVIGGQTTSVSSESREITVAGGATCAAEVINLAQVPGAVRNLSSAFESSFEKRVVLKFDAPASDGGEEIRRYDVSLDGGTTWATLTTQAGTDSDFLAYFSVDGDSNDVKTFAVRAVNLIGSGASSSTQVTHSSGTDTDEDGLSNASETANGTDPNDADSDDDGVNDGVEVASGTDPSDADSDDDGLSDGVETARGTNPTNADSDGDGTADNVDGFPLADTRETTTSSSGSQITIDTTPKTDASSCSLGNDFAVTTVATELPGVAVEGIGLGISFSLQGCSSTAAQSAPGATENGLEKISISIDLGTTPIPEGASAFKIRGDSWTEIPGATIVGSVVTYEIIDNGELDTDPDTGEMADPVTVAVPRSEPPTPVPAIPGLMLLLMSLLLAALGSRRFAW